MIDLPGPIQDGGGGTEYQLPMPHALIKAFCRNTGKRFFLFSSGQSSAPRSIINYIK
jgi:hypothetical protein